MPNAVVLFSPRAVILIVQQLYTRARKEKAKKKKSYLEWFYVLSILFLLRSPSYVLGSCARTARLAPPDRTPLGVACSFIAPHSAKINPSPRRGAPPCQNPPSPATPTAADRGHGQLIDLNGLPAPNLSRHRQQALQVVRWPSPTRCVPAREQGAGGEEEQRKSGAKGRVEQKEERSIRKTGA